MESIRFDELTRLLGRASARRRLLAALAGGALGVAATFPGRVQAGKPRAVEAKPKPNEFGCLEVGDRCGRAAQCCSGICKRRNGKKKCRAHGTGTCNQQKPGRCTAPHPELTACDNRTDCACFATTAGSKFCGFLGGGGAQCSNCKKDTDCEKQGLPPGAACLSTAQGGCAGLCKTGRACMLRCGTEQPEPSPG